MSIGTQSDDPVQPSDQQQSEKSFLPQLIALLEASGVSSSGSFVGNSLLGVLGSQAFQPGEGEERYEIGPDGRPHVHRYSTTAQTDPQAQRVFNALTSAADQVGIPRDYLFKLAFAESRGAPLAQSEGMRGDIVSTIDYMKTTDWGQAVLKSNPDLLKFQGALQQALETYKTPGAYMDALRGGKLPEVARYLNDYSALMSAANARMRLDKEWGYIPEISDQFRDAMRQLRGEQYLTSLFGESTAQKILDKNKKGDTAPCFSDDDIKANPDLANFKGETAQDLVKWAQNQADPDVSSLLRTAPTNQASAISYNARDAQTLHDVNVGNLKAAIFGNESASYRNPYGAIGPERHGDHAYGKYQVMGTNIPSWTQEALGRRMSIDEFVNSPEAQEAVASFKMRQMIERSWSEHGGNRTQKQIVQDVASYWHSGRDYATATALGVGDGHWTTERYGNEAWQKYAALPPPTAAGSGVVPVVSPEPGTPTTTPVYVNGGDVNAGTAWAAANVTSQVSFGECYDGVGRILTHSGLSVPQGKDGRYNAYNEDWLLAHGFHRVTGGTIPPGSVIHMPPGNGLHGHWEWIGADRRVYSDFAQGSRNGHDALYPNANYQRLVKGGQEPIHIFAPNEVPGVVNIPVTANVSAPAPGTAPTPIRVASIGDLRSLDLNIGGATPVQNAPPPLKPGEAGKFYIGGDSLGNQAAIGASAFGVISVADGSSGFGGANNSVGGLQRARWIAQNAPGDAPHNAITFANWQTDAEIKLRAAGVLGADEKIPGSDPTSNAPLGESAKYADWITKHGLTTEAGWRRYGLEPPPFDQKQFTDWLTTSHLRAGDSYALYTSRNNSPNEGVFQANIQSTAKNMRAAWDRGVSVMIVGQAYAGDVDEAGGIARSNYMHTVADNDGLPFYDLQKGQLYIPGQSQPITIQGAALPGAGQPNNVHGSAPAVHFTAAGMQKVGENIVAAMALVKQYTPQPAPAPTPVVATAPAPMPQQASASPSPQTAQAAPAPSAPSPHHVAANATLADLKNLVAMAVDKIGDLEKQLAPKKGSETKTAANDTQVSGSGRPNHASMKGTKKKEKELASNSSPKGPGAVPHTNAPGHGVA